MTYVEVKEHDPGAGNEYMGTKYPGPGIYWVERMCSYYMVATNNTVFAVIGGRLLPEIDKLPEPAVSVAPPQASGISGDDVAKIVAVALHQQAAIALVSKGGAL